MAEKLAFVFSGGGSKGAFGAGVLCEIARRFPRLRWQIVSGTSTGALITPMAALARDDAAALDDLKDLYVTARQKDVVASNLKFPKILRAIFDLPEGLYSLEPLKKRVQKALGSSRLARLRESEVVAVVNAVSLQTGELFLCTQPKHQPTLEAWFAAHPNSLPRPQFLPFADFRKGMRASSSIPLAIEPVVAKRGGTHQLVDGGVIDIAPLRSAIAAGATHVVAVLMSPLASTVELEIRENLLDVALRSVDLLCDEILRNDVEYAGEVNDRQELATRLLVEKDALPARTRAWVVEHEASLRKESTRVRLAVHVIEPPKPLGETLDFDSEKPPGWPEAKRPGPKVGVMQARFDCGVRTAEKRIAEDSDLVRTLERFTIP